MDALLSHPRHDWRPWLREKGGKGLILDPAFAEFGWPGRIVRIEDGRLGTWRFHGSLDPVADPIALLARAEELMEPGLDWALIFPFATPVLRHLAVHLVRRLGPRRILAPRGHLPTAPLWPIGPEEVEAVRPPADIVIHAQRRARWLSLFRASRPHVIDLNSVALEGLRLGSGRMLSAPGEPWLERLGGVLLRVSEDELDDRSAARLMQDHSARRLLQAAPEDYLGLLCSLARQDGEDFSMGIVESFDPAGRRMIVRADAEPEPAVRILRLGTLRLREDGLEGDAVRPWTV
jgi:hypothetical protein